MENYDKYLGQVFNNRYRIDQIIGAGGMSIVYKATDILMKREVAIKVLKDEIAENEESVERFVNESKAVSILSHPNIVHIYDVSIENEIKFIVMEYVEGITLKSYLSKVGYLPYDVALYYTEQILCGLNHAHANGVIHKDIKPQNILIDKKGRIKITDFGIAQLPNHYETESETTAVGTIYYSSPEQINGETLDARSDIYSVGILLYEMITGILPFDGETAQEIAEKQKNDDPIPPTELVDDLPIEVDQLILKALKKPPIKRFQTASQMFIQTKKIIDNYKLENNTQLTTLNYKAPKTKNNTVDVIIKTIIAVLVIGSIIFTSLFLIDRTKNPPVEPVIPTEPIETEPEKDNLLENYSGKNYLDVIVDLSAKGYIAEIFEVECDYVGKDLVIFTTPNAGTEAEPGSTITVYVSKGIN